MLFEDKALILANLMLNAARSGKGLPVIVHKKARKNRPAKQLFVEVMCPPGLTDITGYSYYSSNGKVPYETNCFIRETLLFHGKITSTYYDHSNREKYLKFDHMVIAIKRSKSHTNSQKTVKVNVRQIEIPPTALILFGGKSA